MTGQLAKAAGVHVKTIRYYERRGIPRLLDSCDLKEPTDACPILEVLAGQDAGTVEPFASMFQLLPAAVPLSYLS